METGRMMLRTTAQTKFPLNPNDTDNLDDTLPVELLDCVDTTTNNDWLTRDIPLPGKYSKAPELYTSERGDSLLFNPPLSSTRYKSDGSSSEISDISTTAERGSTCCDENEVCSGFGAKGVNFTSPLHPTPSVEFQPLRCSTDVTSDEVLRVNVDGFQIRVDTNELQSVRKEPEVDRSESAVIFNPPRCSMRLVNKNDDAVKSRAVEQNESVEFNPLRCSTGLVNKGAAVKSNAVERNESVEFNPLRCSTGLSQDVDVKSQTVERNESIEFNPLRCSTGLVNQDAAVKPKASQRLESIVNPLSHSSELKTEEAVAKNPVEVRPASPDEFYVTACNTFNIQNTVRESDTPYVTALSSQVSCPGTGRKSAEGAKLATVQVSEPQLHAQNNVDNVDNDLSIQMQCHLKIRNGRHIVSNVQAKPHIEFSVFKNSPISTCTAVIPKACSTGNQQDSDQSNKRCQTTHNGLNDRPTVGKVHLKSKENGNPNFSSPSAIPSVINLPGSSCILRDKLMRGNVPNVLDSRQSPDIRSENRVQRAMDGLASPNIQKVIPALALLDAARSAPVCEKLVQRGLVNNVYDFLSKMNRSVAHQVACVHATSLLLDLAKYTYSRESAWQNGERLGLLFNLMLIWASKENAIFLNCVTVLWVFSQDKTRANVLQHFVASQNKLLEKISAKLGTKIQRPTNKEPTLQPSWTDLGAPRTYESPCSAFSGLCTALKQLTTRGK